MVYHTAIAIINNKQEPKQVQMPSSGIPIDPSCIQEFKEMEKRHSEIQYLVFTIQNNGKASKIVPEHKGTSLDDFANILQLLPENECRFAFVKVHFDKVEVDPQSNSTVQAGKRTKIVMINWCPMSATVKQRFAFASSTSDFCKTIQYSNSLHVQAGIKSELNMAALVKKCDELVF